MPFIIATGFDFFRFEFRFCSLGLFFPGSSIAICRLLLLMLSPRDRPYMLLCGGGCWAPDKVDGPLDSFPDVFTVGFIARLNGTPEIMLPVIIPFFYNGLI